MRIAMPQVYSIPAYAQHTLSFITLLSCTAVRMFHNLLFTRVRAMLALTRELVCVHLFFDYFPFPRAHQPSQLLYGYVSHYR